MNLNVNIQLGSDDMRTPLDVAEALTALANDMRGRTAGNPHKAITFGGLHTVIAGNVRDREGARVGSWQVKA